MDDFSPLAPSRIRVLVLPVGRIEHARFSHFLRRLQREANVVPLADVEPSSSSSDYELSPKSFPQGCLQYNFTSAAPSDQQLHLSPFELFREPLLVLGLVDGLHDEHQSSTSALSSATAYLRERHPRVVHRQLLVFRHEGHDDGLGQTSSAIGVIGAEQDGHPSLRAALCQVSARFLVELTTYATALQASPTVATPGQTARSLHRMKPLRDGDRRPTSGYRPPTQSSEPQSPVEEGSPSKADLRSRGPPPTTFDQIASANNVPSALARSNSKASNATNKPKHLKRASSQERIAVQGFGSNTSQDKARARGKARVGIVSGSIYMIAGHWSEALRILVEHTTKLRSLSDHLWHGKGLENITVCLLLLAWKGIDFQIPALCNPTHDRNSSSHIPRPSAIIAVEPASGESLQNATIRRLSACIPDLSKTILNLYRFIEGSLELPVLAVTGATIRFSKLLAVLIKCGGELPAWGLQLLVTGLRDGILYSNGLKTRRLAIGLHGLSRNAIADMITEILPSGDDGLSISEQITLLSASASTYALLDLERKKAMVIKDLVVLLRNALIHARKLGAAEMGIHPAASISTETGAETLLAIAGESGGINALMTNVAGIYGASLIPASPSEANLLPDGIQYGNPVLKVAILREFAALCEASPDPYGVIRLNSSLLQVGGPNTALDPNTQLVTSAFSKEEQLQLAAIIGRTVAVSKHLGLPDALATYWDPFLVRGVLFPRSRDELAIIDRTKVKGPTDDRIPGNPLLYDPNASRPGTALPEVFVLVKGEASSCVVTLQNPFDVEIEVESLKLVTDGVELETRFEPTTLGPLRIQPVHCSVNPYSVGETKITGCQIKIQGCRDQVFPVITAPWSAQAPLTLKEPKAGPNSASADPKLLFKSLGIELHITSTVAIDEMPILEFEENEVIDMGIMLLEGEKRSFDMTLRNPSSITAHTFEITDQAGVVRHVQSPTEEKADARPSTAPTDIVIDPGSTTCIRFELTGRAGISSTQVNVYYSSTRSSASKHARLVSFPLNLTVNAALQVRNLDIVPPKDMNEESLQVVFDLGNAWPQSISYACTSSQSTQRGDISRVSPQETGQLSPGELRRLYVYLPRPSDDASATLSDDILRTAFLNQLRLLWTTEERHGQVDLTRLPLSSEASALLRGPLVTLSLTIVTPDDPITIGSFVRMHLTISPRRSDGVQLRGPLAVQLLTARPPNEPTGSRDDDQPHERRFAVVGTLQRVLPDFPHAAGGYAEVDFVICPLLVGVLRFEALVHPAWIGTEDEPNMAARDWHARKGVEVVVHGV